NGPRSGGGSAGEDPLPLRVSASKPNRRDSLLRPRQLQLAVSHRYAQRRDVGVWRRLKRQKRRHLGTWRHARIEQVASMPEGVGRPRRLWIHGEHSPAIVQQPKVRSLRRDRLASTFCTTTSTTVNDPGGPPRPPAVRSWLRCTA